MAQDPSTIPASATVTNLRAEPLGVAGLTFMPGVARVLNLAGMTLAHRALIWNALYNAKVKGHITAPAITFDVTATTTGHQLTQNNGGQDVLGAIA